MNMANSQTSVVTQHLRTLVLLRDGAGLTDGQLLEDYLRRHDEAALAALVRRHGPMVWGVCRRVLRNYQDAEDAFQATFLVLVRKAASVLPREMVANWLYGVAHQTALKARATTVKRKARETQVTEMPEPAVTEQQLWYELQPVLDRELSRLPDKYRVAIVLCDLEGKTRKEAARQLGVPQGTLAARLARGRVRLAKQLARHGLAVSGGSLAVVLAHNAASASAPTSVVFCTIKAASLVAAGHAAAGLVSAKVTALTEGVLKTMLLTKLKVATVVLGMAVMLVLAAPGMLTFAQQDAGKPARTPAVSTPEDKLEGKRTGWREAFVLKHEHPVNIVACSADWIAAGDEGGNLFIYDAKTGKDRRLQIKGGKEEGLTASVDGLQFTPDGKRLFAITQGRRTVCMLNLAKSDKPSPGLSSDDLAFIGVSADGQTWMENHGGKVLNIRGNVWTVPGAGGEYETIAFAAEVSHAVLCPHDKWLAVVTADEKLRIHDRALLTETHTIPLAKQTVNAVQFSKDGTRIAVVGSGSFAKVYDPENGKEVAALKGHRGIIFCVAFSPDGKTIVTGGDDNVARVWDAVTGKPLAVLEGHKDSVRSVAFDPSGEMLITGSADKTVKIWRLTK
jgi:RNA polymerase sigma factor (sigma-70 family)